MYQDIFGYSKFSSVTTMLVELGLPSFNTAFHNAAASLNRRLGCSTNRLVKYVFRLSVTAPNYLSLGWVFLDLLLLNAYLFSVE